MTTKQRPARRYHAPMPQYLANGEEGRQVAVPGLIVSPRLASFGPALNLATLDSAPMYNPAREDTGVTAARVVQVLSSAVVGLIILATPMSALAYAAEQLGAARASTSTQTVPGGAPQPVVDGPKIQPAGG